MLKKDVRPSAFSRSVAVGEINAVLARATSDLGERVRILKTAIEVAERARDRKA